MPGDTPPVTHRRLVTTRPVTAAIGGMRATLGLLKHLVPPVAVRGLFKHGYTHARTCTLRSSRSAMR